MRRRLPYTGSSVGLGGDVAFRVYNKTLELKKKPRKYLEEIWKSAGWQEGQIVWRVEFEIDRDALMELRAAKTDGQQQVPENTFFGIGSVDDLIKYCPAIWGYLTEEWLRIVVPDLDNLSHRERWKTHTVWSGVQSAFSDGLKIPLERKNFDFSRIPEYKRLFKNGFSGLTAYMALSGISDPEEGMLEMLAEGRDFHASWLNNGGLDSYLQEKILGKKKAYNKFISENDLPPTLEEIVDRTPSFDGGGDVYE